MGFENFRRGLKPLSPGDTTLTGSVLHHFMIPDMDLRQSRSLDIITGRQRVVLDMLTGGGRTAGSLAPKSGSN
jgi:hypothetical protein